MDREEEFIAMGKLLMRTNFSPSLDEKKCFKISQDREGISAKEREGKKKVRNLECYRDEGNFHNEGSTLYQFPQRQRGPSPIEISLGDNKRAESYNEGTTSSTRPLVRWDNADSLNI